MVTRPRKIEVFMQMAKTLSTLATCARRQVGCILLDTNWKIIGSGYNGVPNKHIHCTVEPCNGACLKSGEGLDVCLAIHAEQNALMQCTDVTKIAIAVCTTFPCSHCIKMLLNTSCQIIAYSEVYAHNDAHDIWLLSGRTTTKV